MNKSMWLMERGLGGRKHTNKQCQTHYKITKHFQLLFGIFLSYLNFLHLKLEGHLALMILDNLWCFLDHPVKFACFDASPDPWLI